MPDATSRSSQLDRALADLLAQAAEQVRLMTGKQPPVEAMYAALER